MSTYAVGRGGFVPVCPPGLCYVLARDAAGNRWATRTHDYGTGAADVRTLLASGRFGWALVMGGAPPPPLTWCDSLAELLEQ